MKVALLADIHGNANALAAVLHAAREAGAKRVLIAGDMVGYYYEPHRVMKLLEQQDCVMVRGNHEDMLAAWEAGEKRNEIRSKYGSGIEVAAESLSPKQKEKILSLPERIEVDIEGCRVLLCHGTPWDNDEYVYPDAPQATRDRMTDQDCDLVVFGHTHYPLLWRNGRAPTVNPGSVGQPRDRKMGACWALWDTASGDVGLRRESYDVAALVAECRRRDPHLPYLADVLTRT